ncbi:FxsA family protein [Marinimicrobium alkaliphilum]|uniref:FxsA family protein n=1 Tax=Marinimicrobium alkaliphilum TaxID=2202654 RepID=UPI000DB94329|nr:FxsA family protein [Marinimicrobium alkaliphilum]
MGLVLLVLILIPITEIWLLIQVGSEIGAFATIALILLTAAVGLVLVRLQGLSTLMRFNQRVAEGEAPAREMVEGLLLVLTGILMIVPGFATDVVGFALLLPPLRQYLAQRWLSRAGGMSSVHVYHTQGRAKDVTPPTKDPSSGRTLEGDFERKDDER